MNFTWKFLKTLFKQFPNISCELFERAKTGEALSEEVYVEIADKVSIISLDAFYRGLNGLVDNAAVVGSIALDNTQGHIYVKI